MASAKARVKAIFDALLDKDVDDAKITKGVEGVIATRSATPVAQLNDGQKARLFLDLMLGFVKDHVALKRERDAVQNAAQTARAEVDNEFVPTPDPTPAPVVNPTPTATGAAKATPQAALDAQSVEKNNGNK